MSEDIFLSAQQVVSLTDKVQRRAQVRVLRAMGIEHAIRPDGSVVVLRSHIDKVLGGLPENTRRKTKIPEPNWDAV